jgi:hypothetical protein
VEKSRYIVYDINEGSLIKSWDDGKDIFDSVDDIYEFLRSEIQEGEMGTTCLEDYIICALTPLFLLHAEAVCNVYGTPCKGDEI